MTEPLASLSLDLDNQWSYMKTHGDPGWEDYPSYLDVAVPRFLDVLARHDLRITVFIVGQDAALSKNAGAFARIGESPHEVGNHSFNHEPWLHLYTRERVVAELTRAETAITRATGKAPRGFRGPGYSLSQDTLEVLYDLGYAYDASTLPTFIGPLARAYYFMTAKLTEEERRERGVLFGTVRDGLRPLTPYRWRLGHGSMVEIPVTTMPGLRVPMHFSYVLYLATFSKPAALAYFKSALVACRAAGVEPSLLLHPLDFLGADDVPELGFFPAMDMGAKKKIALMDDLLRMLANTFRVVPMSEHAAAASERWLKRVAPRFDHDEPHLQGAVA